MGVVRLVQDTILCDSTALLPPGLSPPVSSSLLLTSRESITPSQFTHDAWNQVSPDNLLLPNQQSLYPLHHGVRITEEVVDNSLSAEKFLLRGQIMELHDKASR